MIYLEAIKTVVVVAAHPDDEMLGCGGTLARLKHLGTEVRILLLGEGPTSRHSTNNDQVSEAAHVSALAAAESMGIKDVRFGNFPDNMFDTTCLLDVVRFVETATADLVPDVIFTHHGGDMNIDHRITHQAVMTAFRPLPGNASQLLLGFEVLSSTEYMPPQTSTPFAPNLYVDIEDYLQRKQAALRCYASEMRPWPHPRSYRAVEHLARMRGCHCGREAAEAFAVYRGVL